MFSVHVIAAIVSELSMQGIEASAALEGTGLAESQLEIHATKSSYRQLDLVMRNALALSNDTAIALRAGRRLHVTSHGMFGYGLLTSATYADALLFANQFMRVPGPCCDIVVTHNGMMGTCRLDPVYWPDSATDTHRFAVELSLSGHLTAARDLVDEAFRFHRVAVDYAAPPHAALYEGLFECPILFSQRSCEYEYHRNISQRTLADARMHAMAREICEEVLSEINRASGIAADVRRLLIEQRGQYPSFEVIAEKLGLSPRSLWRRLAAEGTSYRKLLAESRVRLAIEYLRKTEMTHEEIGSRLGYSDVANFRHAFVRWTGRNPSDFRGN